MQTKRTGEPSQLQSAFLGLKLRNKGLLLIWIPTTQRHDVVAQICHARSLAEKLKPVARMMKLDGGHLVSHERTKEVKDSGCGIQSQDISQIFTRFIHPRSGSNRGSGGVGLGLAICKRFINLMGGHISIESEGHDKGTDNTFVGKLQKRSNANDSAAHKITARAQSSHGLCRFCSAQTSQRY
ncbi:ethylene response sensor 1-like [Syzygium oleosum]|uniref:ethylene response sensor 1-like n=1 Tax=Syzygium oleosum TaxID=219896 RepID=UPI0024BB3302|nr:ethylene response sensor 1-like [Syzygium oleosum]